MAEKLKQKRDRKSNFSVLEEQQLFDSYKARKPSLENPRLPNNLRNDMWETIANEVSGLGWSVRTPKECRTKWQNLHRQAKGEGSVYKNSLVQTGGGSPIKEPRGILNDIIELCRKEPGFSGIGGGLETEICGNFQSICQTLLYTF